MAGRKIRDEADARACLAAAAKCERGRAAWARAHGIDGRSLNAWRVNLEREPDHAGMVELVPFATASPSPTYRIRRGELVVEFDGDFDDGDLHRLLGVVLAC